jgi:YVTN family beta-propeller protein
MSRPHLRFPSLSLLGLLLATACSSSTTTGPGGPVVLEVVPDSVQLTSGDSVQLTVGALDAQGRLVTGVPVGFASSDTAIVRVTNLGLVRSVGPVGSATVIVSGAGLTAVVPVRVVAGGSPPVDSTAFRRIFLPDAGFGVAASAAGAVYVTLLNTGAVVRVNVGTAVLGGTIAVGSVPTNVVFNPAGTRAYVSAQRSQRISVIDVATNAVVDSIPVSGDPYPMAVSGDGLSIFVATNNNVLYKFDLVTKALQGSVALPATAHHVTMNPGRSRLYVATRDGGTVMEIDPATMAVLRTFVLGGRTQGLVVTADSAELWVANEFGNIQVWNLQTGTLAVVVGVSGAFGLARSNDNSTLFATVPGTGRVAVIDRANRTVTRWVLTGGTPRIVAFDPLDGKAVVANEGGWLDVLR